MNDKQWLDKLAHAAEIYKQQNKQIDQELIDNFVRWLYNQWGIFYSKK